MATAPRAPRKRRPVAAVGAGTLLSAANAYVFLVVTARQLGPERYSQLSALWALTYLVGPAAFAPVEQEACRLVVERRTAGLGSRAAVRAVAGAGVAIAVALLALAAAASGPLASRAFAGDTVLLGPLALAVGGYYFMHLSWGVLAGWGDFRGYGIVTGAEGVARLAALAVLVLAGIRSTGWSALCIGVAPFAAATAGWLTRRRQVDGGVPGPVSGVGRRVGYLLVGSVSKQFLLMVGPLAVQVLASGPAQRSAAGRFLAAVTLTRVPLFLFGAALAALLPQLTAEVSGHRRREFAGRLLRMAVGAGVASALTVGAAAVSGPAALRLVFGARYALGRGDLACLAGACGAYLLALVLSYGLIALDRHRSMTTGWLVGSLTLVAVIAGAAPLGLLGRVEAGLLAGSLAAAITMGGGVRQAFGQRDWIAPVTPAGLVGPVS